MSNSFNDPEASYRRGYTQGASDIITAVRGMLPPAEQAKLEAWLGGPARKWRIDNMSGKSKRAPDGGITTKIMPPRHLLRNAEKSN